MKILEHGNTCTFFFTVSPTSRHSASAPRTPVTLNSSDETAAVGIFDAQPHATLILDIRYLFHAA
jgi:hypothetical protein